MRSGYQPDSMSVGSVHEHVPTRTFAFCLEAIGFLSVETRVELFGLRAALRERHHQDPQKDGEADESSDLAAPARHEGQGAEECGHRIDQKHSLLVRQADIEQSVMEVAAVRSERRMPREHAAGEGIKGVDARD